MLSEALLADRAVEDPGALMPVFAAAEAAPELPAERVSQSFSVRSALMLAKVSTLTGLYATCST